MSLGPLLTWFKVLLAGSIKSVHRAFQTLEDVGMALQKMKLMVLERESEETRKTK